MDLQEAFDHGFEAVKTYVDAELSGRIAAAAMVPPELAEQVKQAIHLLHESPPIVMQNAPPRSVLPLPPPRPSRIERNENGGYTLIYDEPQP